ADFFHLTATTRFRTALEAEFGPEPRRDRTLMALRFSSDRSAGRTSRHQAAGPSGLGDFSRDHFHALRGRFHAGARRRAGLPWAAGFGDFNGGSHPARPPL